MDLVKSVSSGDFLKYLLLIWSCDPVAAPPKSIQQGLFGVGDDMSNSLDGDVCIASWTCHRCTFINGIKRRKCEMCLAVDPSRPIKRNRPI